MVRKNTPLNHVATKQERRSYDRWRRCHLDNNARGRSDSAKRTLSRLGYRSLPRVMNLKISRTVTCEGASNAPPLLLTQESSLEMPQCTPTPQCVLKTRRALNPHVTRLRNAYRLRKFFSWTSRSAGATQNKLDNTAPSDIPVNNTNTMDFVSKWWVVMLLMLLPICIALVLDATRNGTSPLHTLGEYMQNRKFWNDHNAWKWQSLHRHMR